MAPEKVPSERTVAQSRSAALVPGGSREAVGQDWSFYGGLGGIVYDKPMQVAVKTAGVSVLPEQAGFPEARSAVTTAYASHWSHRYVRQALVVDAGVALVAVAAATLSRFGQVPGPMYLLALPLLPLAWLGVLAAHGLYDGRYLGAGSEEPRRLLASGVHLGVGLVIASFAAHLDLSRAWSGVLLAVLVMGGLLGRHALRKRVHRARRAGRAMSRTIAVGPAEEVARLVDRLATDPSHGLGVVGACVAPGSDVRALLERGIHRFDTLTSVSDVADMVSRLCADTVLVAGSGCLSPEQLRRLAWRLEPTGTHLVVSPGLSEIGAPRLTVRPAADLSLLHVQHSIPAGLARHAKTVLDRALATLAVILLSPLLLTIGVLVRATSPGPAVYRQRRIGLDGREFTILKFRSMYVDADERRAALLAHADGNGVLFKMRNDPRVTPVGALLRRYSLDELPQLVNVALGHMSLVGPRPPLREEVATYNEDARRRLRVKPGVTGLWQVSGRSDLSWEESLRLDLRYVDNWSLALDLMVLWKTGRAVLRGTGAY